MNLIIDVGNTQCKISVFNGIDVIYHTQSNHPDEITWTSLFQKYNLVNGIFSDTRGIGIESVSLFMPSGFRLVEFNAELPLPIKINYQTPVTLGKDRIAAAVAAHHQFSGIPVLVIDMGTAITIDFVSEQGIFEGGIISPGPELRYRALHQYTGKLPLLEPVMDTILTPNSTKSAIEGGVQNGIIFEIEGYINRYQELYHHLKILLTGGSAFLVKDKIPTEIIYDALLVPKGLNQILNNFLEGN